MENRRRLHQGRRNLSLKQQLNLDQPGQGRPVSSLGVELNYGHGYYCLQVHKVLPQQHLQLLNSWAISHWYINEHSDSAHDYQFQI